MLTIQTCGRFGNNVQQFINAISIAEHKNIPIIKYNFIQFTNNTLRIQQTQQTQQNIKITDMFLTHPQLIEFKEKQRIARKYLLSILKYHKQLTNFEGYYSTGLFVHIRSGDLFKSSEVHPKYTQPPLAYYTKIFSMEPDRQILVFYEDNGNPVVNALKQNYPNIIFHSVSLPILITVFMNAQYIVNSFGTLIQSILLFNINVKKIYSTIEVIPNKTIIIALPNYITEWKNTDEQRALMISYIISDI